MSVSWRKDELSTDPPYTEMAPSDKRSIAITAPAPDNVSSATAVLRNLRDDTTKTIDGDNITATSSQATILVDGDALGMVKGNTYRLEVQFVRSTGIEETARLVIGCPA